ncbi:MAG: FAD-dependent oxidoreductase [Acetobacteraceae bacterium]|nr:FAD-dependent oxidoreductase [Acetobacteraceae bacterium]
MTRIVVIGAGVLGASAAFHAALAGAEVVLVDQEHPGRATAAGAGIVCPWASGADDPEWHRIAQAAARYYPALVEHLAACGETDVGYRRVGALCVSAERADLDHIEQVLRARRATASEMGEVSHLSPAEARRLFPPLRADLAAVHIPGGARVDGRLLAAALRRATERRGGRFQPGTAELLAERGRVTGARVGAETLAADCVVLAAGAWAPALLAPLGLRLAVAPQRGQITHLRLEGAETGAWPIVLPPSSHYLLAFEGGRVVVGATRESGTGFDLRVTAAGQAEVLNEALAVAPGLGPATLVETRVGFRPVGPDVRPMLGRAGPEGLVVGNGLGPTGLTIGPYAGRLLAQVALGEAPEMDLAAYDPGRTG